MADPFSAPIHHGSPQRGLRTWHWLAIMAGVVAVAVVVAVLVVKSGGDSKPNAAAGSSSGAPGASGVSGTSAAKQKNGKDMPQGAGTVVHMNGGMGTKGGGTTASASPSTSASGITSASPSDSSASGNPSGHPSIHHIPIASVSVIGVQPVVHPKLNYQAAAAYGEANLSNGFSPDPYSVGVTVGGSVDVSYLGGSCSGFADAAPTLRVNFGGGATLLRIYAIGSSGDASFVVNDPYGNFYCVDDSFGTVNPTIDFNNPAGGSYDVWLCSASSGSMISGTLYLTENSGNHP